MVRKVVAATGIITTVAGLVNRGDIGFNGDNQPATSAQLGGTNSVAVDSAGNLYIADGDNDRVRKVDLNGIITTIAGNGVPDYSGDGGPALSAQLNMPVHVATDRAGSLYIADPGNSTIRKVSRAGVITTIAGKGSGLSFPQGVAADSAGNVYIADSFVVWKLDATGKLTRFSGSEPANSYTMAADRQGNLYVVEPILNRVRKFSPDGNATVVAGTGQAGFSGDGGPATNAQLNFPRGIAVDLAGNLYIGDEQNYRVRRVSADGTITTVVGDGTPGLPQDGVPATRAHVTPVDVAVDASGALYVLQFSPPVVRKVGLDGVIRTVAGHGSAFGYSGDGGPATDAQFYRTFGLAVDLAGDVYVADSGNRAVRMLKPAGPLQSIGAMTNAASNLPGAIAPGEILLLYGVGMGPADIASGSLGSDGRFGTQLGGTTVTVNAIPAPLLYASAGQVSAVVPYGVGAGDAQLAVTYQGQSTAAIAALIASAAPGVFTIDSSGSGQAAAINQNGSRNSAANPAPSGEVITLFVTGEGATSPGGTDGLPATTPLPHPVSGVRVMIGGAEAQVQYAGGAPGIVAGVMQVNAVIPVGIVAGPAVPVSVLVGDVATQAGVSIAVR